MLQGLTAEEPLVMLLVTLYCAEGQNDVTADSPSPFSLLYSDLITLALPKRLKRFLTLSWYQPAVPIFTTLHTTLTISLASGQEKSRVIYHVKVDHQRDPSVEEKMW